MTGYVEVRQSADGLKSLGIRAGDGVVVRTGPFVDYEPGDVVLVGNPGDAEVGWLMLFQGVTENAAGVVLTMEPEGPRGFVRGAHEVEFRGRALRDRSELTAYRMSQSAGFAE